MPKLNADLRKFFWDFYFVDNNDCPRCGSDCGYEGGTLGTVKRVIVGDEAIYTCEKCGYEMHVSKKMCEEMIAVLHEK
jgi:ribosomal protein S27AE